MIQTQKEVTTGLVLQRHRQNRHRQIQLNRKSRRYSRRRQNRRQLNRRLSFTCSWAVSDGLPACTRSRLIPFEGTWSGPSEEATEGYGMVRKEWKVWSVSYTAIVTLHTSPNYGVLKDASSHTSVQNIASVQESTSREQHCLGLSLPLPLQLSHHHLPTPSHRTI